MVGSGAGDRQCRRDGRWPHLHRVAQPPPRPGVSCAAQEFPLDAALSGGARHRNPSRPRVRQRHRARLPGPRQRQAARPPPRRFRLGRDVRPERRGPGRRPPGHRRRPAVPWPDAGRRPADALRDDGRRHRGPDPPPRPTSRPTSWASRSAAAWHCGRRSSIRRLVRRLVLVSTPFKRAGWHPEMVAGFDAMGPEIAEPFKQTPMYEVYREIAPRVEDWPILVTQLTGAAQARLRLDRRGPGPADAGADRRRRRGRPAAPPRGRVLRAPRRRPARCGLGPLRDDQARPRDPAPR